jgi:hypothetical protein
MFTSIHYIKKRTRKAPFAVILASARLRADAPCKDVLAVRHVATEATAGAEYSSTFSRRCTYFSKQHDIGSIDCMYGTNRLKEQCDAGTPV